MEEYYVPINDLEDGIKKVSKMFGEKWSTGFNYDKAEPIFFKGNPLDYSILRNAFFQKNLYYISRLFEFIDFHKSYDGEDLSELEKKEMIKWEKNRGQCIYFSVLLYSLLVYDKVLHESEISYCQGMYKHDCRADNPLGRMIFGEEHAGLHAWIEANGGIIDISIGQEEQFFDFGEKPFILGEVPNGFDLVGFRETTKTVKDYARNIAKDAGMKYETWLQYHSINATKLFLKYKGKL